MPAAHATYLDPHTLAAIDSLELRARMIVEGLMAGMHRSPYHGFSVEFAQHRPYAPGDDLRHLDWKVYGRADKLYLKQYQQETNLDLVILVDASGSMAYGSDAPRRGKPWTKYDHAATLAAALSHLALHQQDRVGLTLFARQVLDTTRASNAQGHWQAIVNALASRAPSLKTDEQDGADRGTDLARLFDQILAKLTQRSLIVLISDLFEDADALQRGLARVQFNRHDLIILQVLDHAEITFPFRDPSRFVGLEGELPVGLDPPAWRDAYLDSLQAHQRGVERIARRFRFDHLLLDSSESLGGPLGRFLAYRAAVARRGNK